VGNKVILVTLTTMKLLRPFRTNGIGRRLEDTRSSFKVRTQKTTRILHLIRRNKKIS
jgi:hypothetical protein